MLLHLYCFCQPIDVFASQKDRGYFILLGIFILASRKMNATLRIIHYCIE